MGCKKRNDNGFSKKESTGKRPKLGETPQESRKAVLFKSIQKAGPEKSFEWTVGSPGNGGITGEAKGTPSKRHTRQKKETCQKTAGKNKQKDKKWNRIESGRGGKGGYRGVANGIGVTVRRALKNV